jgi:hypothetical protein
MLNVGVFVQAGVHGASSFAADCADFAEPTAKDGLRDETNFNFRRIPLILMASHDQRKPISREFLRRRNFFFH